MVIYAVPPSCSSVELVCWIAHCRHILIELRYTLRDWSRCRKWTLAYFHGKTRFAQVLRWISETIVGRKKRHSPKISSHYTTFYTSDSGWMAKAWKFVIESEFSRPGRCNSTTLEKKTDTHIETCSEIGKWEVKFENKLSRDSVRRRKTEQKPYRNRRLYSS